MSEQSFENARTAVSTLLCGYVFATTRMYGSPEWSSAMTRSAMNSPGSGFAYDSSAASSVTRIASNGVRV